MAAGKDRKTHNVEQTEKVFPLITCEVPFCQYACKLVFGVDIFDLDVGSKLVCQTTNQARLCGP